MSRNLVVLAVLVALWLALGLYTAGISNARARAEFALLARDTAWTERECRGALRSGLIFGPIAAWEETRLSGFPPSDWTLSCAAVSETSGRVGR